MTQPTHIQAPVFQAPPINAHMGAERAAEHAIYSLKSKLSEEHFARTGHDAAIAPRKSCKMCATIMAGVVKMVYPPGRYWDPNKNRMIEYPKEPLPR